MMHIKEILIFSSILFSIGIYGALTRRNMIGILMSIELIFNSCCLNFVVFSKYHHPALLTGEIFVLFIISIAAAEVAIGLALLLSIYRHYKNISSDKINLMKG
ncbi:MAG: NADH-quinone oxidoreductase subunit NuoK [Candidatus Omnitrophota bacterium]|nr:NADH-quinone oxidoreductase subunit NuoK [Candidatus Omnitrophota bacterium]